MRGNTSDLHLVRFGCFSKPNSDSFFLPILVGKWTRTACGRGRMAVPVVSSFDRAISSLQPVSLTQWPTMANLLQFEPQVPTLDWRSHLSRPDLSLILNKQYEISGYNTRSESSRFLLCRDPEP
jgi:hypothetical protein